MIWIFPHPLMHTENYIKLSKTFKSWPWIINNKQKKFMLISAGFAKTELTGQKIRWKKISRTKLFWPCNWEKRRISLIQAWFWLIYTYKTYPASSLYKQEGGTRTRGVPPHVAALGEEGELDDLGGHPGVRPRCAHLGGLVPLSGQTEVCDLQGSPSQVLPLHRLQDEDWGREADEDLC